MCEACLSILGTPDPITRPPGAKTDAGSGQASQPGHRYLRALVDMLEDVEQSLATASDEVANARSQLRFWLKHNLV